MFLWWGEDHIQFYNDAYRPSLGNGGKHPTALGQKGEECWPEIWPTIYPLMKQVLAGEEAAWQENALIPIYRNGALEDVYWTFSYSPVKGESGKVEGVLVVCTETTKSIQNLQKIQISEHRFSNLIRQAKIGIIVLEGEEMVVSLVNEAYGRIIGRQPHELLGKELFTIIPEVEHPFRALLNNVRLTGEPLYLYDQPYVVFPGGEKIEGYLNVVYEPYREMDGPITGVMALVQDVTQQVINAKRVAETEASAQGTAERLELALAAASLGSFELIFGTTEVACNDECRRQLGMPMRGAIFYEEILDKILPEDKAGKERSLAEAIEKHIPYNAEYRVRWSDGTIRWIRAAGNPVYNEKGEPVKMVGITIDITGEKLFTEELASQVNKRTQELQRSNDDLLQFAHVTSHDLKEPVRKIKIWTNRLQTELHTELSENGKFYLSRLQHATDRIQLMIDSILTFSSASSSNQVIDKVDLNDVLEQVETDLEIVIQDKKAVIRKEPLPVIEGAGILLYQLFYNLINNALKFTRPEVAPFITISTTTIQQGEENKVILTIADNGIGFNNKYKAKIFSAFTRLNSKDVFEGTGLGLALCQKIAERHGGEITSWGEEGKGASFTVTLPVLQSHRTIQNLLSADA